MRSVTLDELRLNLHELVDLLCEASPGERAKALAQMRRRQRLYLQLQEYLDEKDGRLDPDSIPLAQSISEPSAPAVLEGRFIRLLQGGKLLLESGEHRLLESEVVGSGLQHGDIVRAVPDSASHFEYEVWRPGPLVAPAAVQELGYPEYLDEDLALVRTQHGDEVQVALRDMQGLGATLSHVLTVAFVRDAMPGGHYLGRVLKVHTTPVKLSLPRPKPEQIRKKRAPDLDHSSPVPVPVSAPLPRFQPIHGKKPTIVFVGGHPQNRAKYECLLAEYGAILRGIPYSPKARQVRMAVDASDIVIGFPNCCRTCHWQTALDTARRSKRLFFYGESENESGLRLQIETEIIPHWNSLSSNANSA
jgi:hypothetical protein